MGLGPGTRPLRSYQPTPISQPHRTHPPDIALVHFHLRTWWLLRDAAAGRRGKAAAGRRRAVDALLAPLINDGVALAI